MSDTNGISQRKSGMSRLVQDKGSRKLLIFVAVVAVVVIGWLTLGGSTVKPEHSAFRAPPQMPVEHVAKAVTPDYDATLQKDSSQRIAAARKTNGDFTPPLVMPPANDRLPTTLPGNDDERPPEIPVGQKPPTQPMLAAPAQAQRPVVVAAARPPVADQALEQAMLHEMQTMQPGAPAAAQTVYFYNPQETSAGGAQAAQQGGFGGQSSSGRAYAQNGQSYSGQGYGARAGSDRPPGSTATENAAVVQTPKSRFIAPAAGSIVYAHLLGRVNSDTPGPVIGEILQGPFANARLLGTFQFSEQGVIISFATMTVPYKDENGDDKSEVVPIHAVAVDASHLGTAMATDIDRHLLERVGVAFGTAFLQGLGQAVAQSGSTVSAGLTGTVVSNATLNTKDQLLVGAGSAANAAGQVFNQVYGNRRTTITVEADTPMGVLFLGNGNN